ncbi:MAG: polysaccharide deacetylase family protein [Chlorobi bacterium]|nr:polysaccharide deacetylase family protein [Chlorobiota bacterium]
MNYELKKIFYTPPKILQRIFNNFVWESKVDKILLTFDDGPNPGSTKIILDRLNRHNIKALFFCVGENVNKYPNLVKQIIAEGHTIGNHSYSHKNITFTSKVKIDEQIKLCSDIIREEIEAAPQFFRPPHGRFDFRTNRIVLKHQLKNIMWSLLTYDYKNDLNIVKFAIQNYITKSSIIVLHDSEKSKDIIGASIDFIVEAADKRGFEFGEISECLK